MAEEFSGHEVVDTIRSIPGNEICADCGCSDPTWASSNVGTVICIKCSGVHRNIGAHVTQVLSLSLDSWTQEQIDHMQSLGNIKVNAELEHTLPPAVSKPTHDSNHGYLESYIRAKYELGSFRDGGDGMIPHVRLESTNQVGMVEYIGVLMVHLKSAAQLPSMDIFSKSDPFCVFKSGDKECKSKVIDNQNDPVWNETLTMNIQSLKHPLSIECWDKDELTTNDFIGAASLDISSLKGTCDRMPFMVKLEGPAIRKKNLESTVTFELEFMNLQ